MKIRGLGHSTEDFLQIWSEMHNKQVQILNEESEDRSTDKAIVWSSQLTSPEFIERYLNKDKFIVQTWVSDTDLLNQKLLRLGYKLIISTENAWYLDHGFWGGTKYQNWRAAYKNIIPQEVVTFLIIEYVLRHDTWYKHKNSMTTDKHHEYYQT